MTVHPVSYTSLPPISNPLGDIFHILKSTDSAYSDFGEVYFSFLNPRAIKGWKKHTTMIMNLVVPAGNVRFVFYHDDTFSSHTLSPSSYGRLTVQPNVWFAFQSLSEDQSIVLNLANIVHDPSESLTMPLSSLDFSW